MLDFNATQDPTEALRATFRRHASGVSVITTVDADNNPVGFTATSMTSLGATPPLVMFSVARGASSWNAISTAKFIAIHTLGEENVELAKRMAADHTQRFLGDDWQRGPENLPIFDCATSVLIGKVRDVLNIENNAVVICDVVSGALGTDDEALLYFQRAYRATGNTLA
jgi:flavin reductase (DIM6/NTAB) family NADH-FMN oxidoreductase RutF